MRGFFSQANLVRAAVIVAVLMFVVPMILAQQAVANLVTPLGRAGGFIGNMLGVLLALFIVRQTKLAG